MSNETKRDVFDGLLKEHCKTILDLNPASAETDVKQIVENVFRDRYAAALPDDLPTIPEVVDEFIRGWGYATLVMIFSQAKHLSAFAQTEREQHGWQWIVDNEDEFARAWIYGVWRVEETGEIVKLEADK